MQNHTTRPLRLVLAVNASSGELLTDLENNDGTYPIRRALLDLGEPDRGDANQNARLTIYHTGLGSDGVATSSRKAFLASRRSTYEQAKMSPWVITEDNDATAPFTLEVPFCNDLQLFLERDPLTPNAEHSLVLQGVAVRFKH